MIGVIGLLGWLASAPAHATPVVPVELRPQLEQAPLAPELRLALASALLERRERTDEALEMLSVLTGDPAVGPDARAALARALTAAPGRRAWSELYRKALTGATAAEQGALRARQAEASREAPAPASGERPVDAPTLRAQAETRIVSGDPGAARMILSGALDADPADRATLGVYTRAAIAEGDVLPALSRARAALAAAPDARARGALVDDVLALQVLAAEQFKQAGQPDAAFDNYVLALALRPPAFGTLCGAAGLAWQLQDLEAAWSLYNRALGLKPDDVDTLLSAVAVGLTAGHAEDANRLVERSRSRDPRVVALRTTIAQAVQAEGARAALRAGDAARAATAFQALLASGATDGDYFRGLATALTSLGRNEDALAAWEGLLRVSPGDAWGAIGLANALVALDRPTEARQRLAESFPADPPPGAEDERRRVVARAWRQDAEHARERGDALGAWESYAHALDAFPDVWGCVGVAGLYLEDGQPSLALDFYDEALRLQAGVPEAMIGRAQALEALGRGAEAMDALAGLDATGPEVQALRVAVSARVAVSSAMALRAAGRGEDAEAALAAAIEAGAVTPDLLAAQAVLRLDRGDAAGALDAARAAFVLDPDARWPRQALVTAARAAGRSGAIVDLLEIAEGVDPTAAAERDDARLDAALQEAARAPRDAAARVVQEAAPLARTAEQLDRLGGGWLAAGRGVEAEAAFARALALDPGDVDARIGHAGARSLQGHRAGARAELARAYRAAPDARLGLAIASIHADRGDYGSAARTLRNVAPTVTLPTQVAAPERQPRLDPLPLPSGRAWSRTPAVAPVPRTLDLRDARARLQAEVDAHRGPRASAEVVVVDRGMAGAPNLTALLMPVRAGPYALGPVRVDVEAVPVHLDDGSDTADGVSASVGVATPKPQSIDASARVGVSPLGFIGGAYPVWSARVIGRVGPSVRVGLQTDRAPRGDSRISWAGGVEPATLRTFARVSELDARAFVSASPAPYDVGLSLRGGYVEGIGVPPNPFAEGVAWAARVFPVGPLDLRAGVEGVGMTYARQEDRLVLGQGGYFSPPLFALGLARLDGHLALTRGAVCAGVGAGPRWLTGSSSTFAGSGLGVTAIGHVGGAFQLAPRWALTVDARGQLNGDGWHQISGLARLAWGIPTTLGAAPSRATVTAPSLALPTDDDLCTYLR